MSESYTNLFSSNQSQYLADCDLTTPVGQNPKWNIPADYTMTNPTSLFSMEPPAALYAGSFDPFTNGHLSVLDQAARIFSRVYVCVVQNPNKKRMLDTATAAHLIEQIVEQRYINVSVIQASTGLLYRQAELCHCKFLVRGIRNNGLDYTYEENLAQFNQTAGKISTVFLRAEDTSHISSTLVKTLLAEQEDISAFVPPNVAEYLLKKG